MAIPRARPPPLGRPNMRAGSATAAGLPASRDPQLLLDARDHALLRVEELDHHGLPAAELLDGEERLRRGELLRIHEARIDRAVALGREDPLRLPCPEEAHERPRLRRVLGRLG